MPIDATPLGQVVVAVAAKLTGDPTVLLFAGMSPVRLSPVER